MKKPGRPSDDYPRAEFRNLIRDRRQMLGLSIKGLAALAHMNHGTLSQLLDGSRPCGRVDRAALIHALELGDEAEIRFALSNGRVRGTSPANTASSTHKGLLQSGYHHLLRAEYTISIKIFESVFRSSKAGNKADIQADAAMSMAWVYFEQGDLEDCERWIGVSLECLSYHLGATLEQILDSLKPGSFSAVCSATEYEGHILWAVLHFWRTPLSRNRVLRSRTEVFGQRTHPAESSRYASKAEFF